MSTQLEVLESKNTSSSTSGSASTNKVTNGKKAKPQKQKFVKISFLVEASDELRFRLAAIQLEIAGEAIHTHNEMGREMVSRYLDWLGRGKKVNFSSIPQSTIPNE